MVYTPCVMENNTVRMIKVAAKIALLAGFALYFASIVRTCATV